MMVPPDEPRGVFEVTIEQGGVVKRMVIKSMDRPETLNSMSDYIRRRWPWWKVKRVK